MSAFAVMAVLLNMAEVEVNPTSRRAEAMGHSGTEVTAFAIKLLLTLVGAFISFRRVVGILRLCLALWLLWESARWVSLRLCWVGLARTAQHSAAQGPSSAVCAGGGGGGGGVTGAVQVRTAGLNQGAWPGVAAADAPA